MRRSLLAFTAVLAMLVIPVAANALAGDRADGRGLTAQDERFDFNAVGTGLADRADGRAKHILMVADPNFTISGNVTCMLIVGRQAVIGGVITSVKPGPGAVGAFPGDGFTIFAEDNAKPSNGLDLYRFDLTGERGAPECAIPMFSFGSPVIKGDIEITPGL